MCVFRELIFSEIGILHSGQSPTVALGRCETSGRDRGATVAERP